MSKPRVFTSAEVVNYFVVIKKYRNFNWTSDDFRGMYEGEGFTKNEDGVFINPGLSEDIINLFT